LSQPEEGSVTFTGHPDRFGREIWSSFIALRNMELTMGIEPATC
jgi:hypothetical protein